MKNIHLLPTDKPSRVYYNVGGALLFTSYENHNGVNIYITNDEEIKEGDWFIHPDSSCFDKECKEVSIGGYEILQVIKVDENFIYHSAMMAIHKNKNIKKIILTTDQDLIKDGVQSIDDELLEWFVKNPSYDMVEVGTYHVKGDISGKLHYKIIIPQKESKQEYEYIGKCNGNEGNGCFLDSPGHNCGCFNRVPKQETLEEVSERLAGEYRDVRINPSTKFQIQQLIIKGAKWQAERMYTEDEVRELLDMQRGNSYVAVLNKTRNVDIASLASSAPEPMGKDGWVKK
jgi:hypothetical protein